MGNSVMQNLFCTRKSTKICIYFLKHAINRNCKHSDKYLGNYFLGMTVSVRVRIVLTAELNLQHLNVKITSSLKLSADVALNPGPYEITRSVQETLNQGFVVLFGETAGRQCACNALLSICW